MPVNLGFSVELRRIEFLTSSMPWNRTVLLRALSPSFKIIYMMAGMYSDVHGPVLSFLLSFSRRRSIKKPVAPDGFAATVIDGKRRKVYGRLKADVAEKLRKLEAGATAPSATTVTETLTTFLEHDVRNEGPCSGHPRSIPLVVRHNRRAPGSHPPRPAQRGRCRGPVRATARTSCVRRWSRSDRRSLKPSTLQSTTAGMDATWLNVFTSAGQGSPHISEGQSTGARRRPQAPRRPPRASGKRSHVSATR